MESQKSIICHLNEQYRSALSLFTIWCNGGLGILSPGDSDSGGMVVVCP